MLGNGRITKCMVKALGPIPPEVSTLGNGGKAKGVAREPTHMPMEESMSDNTKRIRNGTESNTTRVGK